MSFQRRDECDYTEKDCVYQAACEHLEELSLDIGREAYDAFSQMFEAFEGLNDLSSVDEVADVKRQLNDVYDKMNRALDIEEKLAAGIDVNDLDENLGLD